jgi:two-component system sensor histidine kinase YesM
MRILKKLILAVDNISFKSKIAIVFTIFCILQTILMSGIFYQQNMDTMRQNTETQLLSVVKTKNELVDMRLKSISESIGLFNFDSKLFEIFDAYDTYAPFEKLLAPAQLQTLFFRYFGNAADIYSINLLSSQFSTSNKPYHFEYSDFIHSDVLYHPENDRNFFQYWIPRFNLRDFVEEVNPLSDVRYGFAAIKRLNLTTLYNTSFITLSPLVDKPYLLIAFDESFFGHFYENATGFKDSQYTVISPNGQIISGSSLPPGNNTLPPWFDTAKEMKNGITYVNIDGNETLVCFSTSNETRWITAITTPVASLAIHTVSMQRQFILISLVLAAFMLIFYFQSAAVLAKPIRQLAKSASGAANTIQPTSNEIKLLSYAFDKIKLNEKEAKIATLNAQIKPHFIYNTLNTINWMAMENNETKISKMVLSLSSILQYSFEDHEIVVHFTEEINWLKQYVYIMSTRFTGKFVVEYDLDPVLYNCYVPKLLLQPLVENSIIHGFHNRSSGGVILISGWIDGQDVYLSVIDNGCGISEQKAATLLQDTNSSIGCRNVDHKLKLIFGPQYGLEISSTENRGTTVTAKMPVRNSR